MTSTLLPMPPLELRQLIGPPAPESFDNPRGELVYANFGFPPEAYESVFDFGCGCGRVARQLIQQNPRPRRYVGIDPHRDMIDWCRRHLSPCDRSFQFHHHNVYAPSYAPTNEMQLAAPFPVGDGEFSLFIANSVFTHLCQRQTEFYLSEIARILAPHGVAFTTWFFFDRDSFPFLRNGRASLYVDEANFDEAVIYDRRWFLETVQRLGLSVRSTNLPGMAGSQWVVLLEKRTAGTVDHFPLGADGAEWLCGTTVKSLPAPTWTPDVVAKVNSHAQSSLAGTNVVAQPAGGRPPELFEALAQLKAIRQSWSWRVGRVVTAPARLLKRVLRP